MRHLLYFVDKMCKYKMCLASIAENTDQTRFCPQMHDAGKDGWTDGQSETCITHFNFVDAWDTIKIVFSSFLVCSLNGQISVDWTLVGHSNVSHLSIMHVWPFIHVTQRTHDTIITPLLRQNDVLMSFWRNNDVMIALCVRWVLSIMDGVSVIKMTHLRRK